MVNVNDIEMPKEIPELIWKAIFDKQLELAMKYSEIENMSDLLKTTTTNIDTAVGQKWIKDFAWRTTEELTEADEARHFANEQAESGDPEMAEQYTAHYIEELIDALHFLTELCIIAGYTETIINKDFTYPLAESYDVIYNLGLACNCLKNKPWKQTQMLTDRPKFKRYISRTYGYLTSLFRQMKMSDEDIYKIYYKKMSVNQFRIRSKY